MSDCRKCLWREQCFTYADCEYYDPIVVDIAGEVDADKVAYTAAFWEYISEFSGNSDIFLEYQHNPMKRGGNHF